MEEIFPFGRPVSGRHFVGREREVKDIFSLLENNQSIMLIAPRRYGKTSLVLEVMRMLKREGWYVGRVDLFDIPTREKLAEKIVQATVGNKIVSTDRLINAAKRGIRALREVMELKQITQDGMEIILSFADAHQDIDALLDESLDFPERFASKHDARMCFAYDELGDMSKMNGELIKKMRSKFQMHKRTVYLFSGSQETVMNEIFLDKRGAFYGFCQVMELAPIPKQAFKDYISKTFERAGVYIELETIDDVLERTACHPYYTQYLCQVIYLNVKERGKVEEGDVEGCFEQMMHLQQTYLEGIWASLKHDSVLQLRICLHLSSRPRASVYSEFDDTRQNVYASLQSLLRKGHIRREEGGYELADPLFREYLKRKEA
jgi:AAA+ ATPase superfamily predicted ATPase